VILWSAHEYFCAIHRTPDDHHVVDASHRDGRRLGFSKLPVSLLPRVDYPTIVVNAQLRGASPRTVATDSPLIRKR